MVIPRNATVFHIQFGARKGTPPGFQYDLGHGIGPRAFGPHAFTGDRTIWGSLEQRVFLIDEFYDLFGVGFAAFVDYGGAWYDDQPRRLGGNVGFGLRLGSTRSTAQNVGRIDLGYRFGDGWEGKRLALSFGRGFAF
jgi:hemolysin activation/secretion protein